MGYIRIISEYPPYALMQDKRGFISKRYGNGHSGIDSVGNMYANPVCALIDGVVTAVSNSKTLGNVVEYSNGATLIKYYHLASVAVSVGEEVKAGETKIGVEGSTGSLATGKHLHITICINGKEVDPEPYLDGRFFFPTMKEGQYMIKKVVKPLNVRSTKSLSSNANIVYKDMPVGTKFLVTETTTEGGVTWGKIFTVIDGKTVAGWSNLAATWSVDV